MQSVQIIAKKLLDIFVFKDNDYFRVEIGKVKYIGKWSEEMNGRETANTDRELSFATLLLVLSNVQ